MKVVSSNISQIELNIYIKNLPLLHFGLDFLHRNINDNCPILSFN